MTPTEKRIYSDFASKNFERSRRFGGGEYTLGPMTELLNTFGNPQRDLKILHVAGTNGKGSVCRYLGRMYNSAGFSAGVYLSPHLENVHERFLLNENVIPDKKLSLYYSMVKEKAERIPVSFFDVLTAIALLYFRDEQADRVILETGLGGRLDSTNVVLPVASVLTPIGIDHQKILGETLTQIAREKAGIIKEDIPLFMMPQKKEAEQILRDVARKKNSPVIPVGLQAESNAGEEDYRILNYEAAKDILKKLEGVSVDCAIGIRGRLERLDANRDIYFDAGHNEEAARAVATWMATQDKKWSLSVNVLRERDLPRIIESFQSILKENLEKVFLIPTSDSNGLFYTASDFSNPPLPPEINLTMPPSIDAWMKQLNKERQAAMIFGSFRFYSEVKRALSQSPR